MKNIRSYTVVALTMLLVTGCTFAKYSKLRVQVVDAETYSGIPGAKVSVFYIKPTLDMTYQHEDCKRTDANGFATLSVATNGSQLMPLGWTHGICPALLVQADGYRVQPFGQLIGMPRNSFHQTEPLIIELTRTNRPPPDMHRY